MEASKEIPGKDIVLYTASGEYHQFKVDTLAHKCTYSTGREGGFNLVTISAQRAFDVYHMNKRGEKPEKLDIDEGEATSSPEFTDGVGDEALNRFDRTKKKKKRANKNHNNDKKQQENGFQGSPSNGNGANSGGSNDDTERMQRPRGRNGA
jgi:hypothetical protein